MHVSIRPHEFFQREQANILMRVPLRMTQAALGDEIEVPVIDGSRAKVKIPAGTQTGDQFRLRGKGFSVLRSAARGDMFIQVAVETPQNLSPRQRELLEAFEAEAAKGSKGSPESMKGSSPRWRRSSRAAGDRFRRRPGLRRRATWPSASWLNRNRYIRTSSEEGTLPEALSDHHTGRG